MRPIGHSTSLLAGLSPSSKRTSRSGWPNTQGYLEGLTHRQKHIMGRSITPRVAHYTRHARPTHGTQPYEILFGRPRNMATLPWDPQQKCEEAEEFLAKMTQIDKEIAQRLNSHHEKMQASQNKKRPQDPHIYKPNDMAWVLRPNETGGIKLETRWHGPYRVITRTGEFSYQVKMADNSLFDVHVSHMKPCHWEIIQGPHTILRIPPTQPTPPDSTTEDSD